MWVTDALCWAPAWLWCVLAVGLLVYLFAVWPYITTSITVPGPKPLPFVGNMMEINKIGVIKSDAANLKKYGRVFLTWFGRSPVINIADPDMVKQICVKEFQNYTNRPVGVPLSPVQKAMVSALEDDHWKFVRSVLSPAFTSGRMRKMVPLIHHCLNRLITNLSEYSKSGKSFEAKSVMGGLTMEVIGAVGFGIETDVQKDLNDRFMVMAKRVFEENTLTKIPVIISFLFPALIPIFEALDMTADSKDVTDFFVTLLNKTIDERRKQPSPRKDLLQLILDSSVEDLNETLADKDVDVDALKMDGLYRNNKLSDTEAVAQALVFLIAGFETTAAALSYFAYNMALNPECQDKLISEIDDVLNGAEPTYDNVMTLPYLDMCLSETQRLYPAIRGTARVAGQSMTIDGVHIPAKATVILLGYALQRDVTYWSEPEKFDPERWTPDKKAARHPYVYFPFGVGPRNCVGMRLAQMEVKMAVVSMLQKFRFIRAPETEVPLTLKKGLFIQAENGIWLRIEARD